MVQRSRCNRKIELADGLPLSEQPGVLISESPSDLLSEREDSHSCEKSSEPFYGLRRVPRA